MDGGKPLNFSEFDVIYMRDEIIFMKYDLKLGGKFRINKRQRKQTPGIRVVSSYNATMKLCIHFYRKYTYIHTCVCICLCVYEIAVELLDHRLFLVHI